MIDRRVGGHFERGYSNILSIQNSVLKEGAAPSISASPSRRKNEVPAYVRLSLF